MNEINEAASGGSILLSLKKAVIVRLFAAFLLLGLMFFLPAWSFDYWQAWVYILIIIVPMTIMSWYLYKHDPELLERRMRTKEKQSTQKMVVILSFLFYVPAFVIPGFDVRFGWSNVPWVVVIVAEALVLFGYLLFIIVLRTNSYASRVIEVEKDQVVITTGLYAIVRHPIYLAMLILCTFSPLALGSYWAMILVVILVVLIIVRIKGEEQELLKNLKGYKAYVTKTKYRLIPGIW
jgi:protein-S-isoprenylcysteine O-methyltransferase Ste14